MDVDVNHPVSGLDDDALAGVLAITLNAEFKHKMVTGRWLMLNPKPKAVKIRMAEKLNVELSTLEHYEEMAVEFQDWSVEDLPTTFSVAEELLRIPDALAREEIFREKPPQEWSLKDMKTTVRAWIKDHTVDVPAANQTRQGFVIPKQGDLRVNVVGDFSDPAFVMLEIKHPKGDDTKTLTPGVRVTPHYVEITETLYIKIEFENTEED